MCDRATVIEEIAQLVEHEAAEWNEYHPRYPAAGVLLDMAARIRALSNP